MKRALPLLLAALLALPLLAADARSEKRDLIDEVLRLLDARALTEGTFHRFMLAMREPTMSAEPGDEELAEFDELAEEGRRQEEEQMRLYRERLFARLDHTRFIEEIYVPLLDRNFSDEELRALIAFLKTDTGQKLAAVVPDLGIGGLARGTTLFDQAMRETHEELQKEQKARYPAQGTMADMRTLATALEARATDTNEYPRGDIDALPSLLEPTYIREAPTVDSWGTPFLYVSDGRSYRLVSAGADKRFEWDSRRLDPHGVRKESDSLDADIVFQDGDFIQLPRQE